MASGLRRLIFALICFLGLCGEAAGELDSYDGRMKLKTDHFVFLFEPADSAAANHLASLAEDAYTRVTSYYGSYPQTIYCVIDGRSDAYTSAYIPLPAHIRIAVHGPTWPLFSPRNSDWLELVLIHELTHNVQLTYNSGFFYALSRVFGGGLHAFQGLFLPTWAVEGPGILAETLLTSGGRGDSEHFEMLAKVFVDDLPHYSRAGSSTVFEPPQRPYVAGYLIADYLHRTYGTAALQSIHQEFVRFPFFGPGRAVKRVTGKSAKEIFEEAIADAQLRFRVNGAQSDSKRITPEVYGDYYLPQVTERGWIMYRYTHDLPAALVLYDPDSGREDVLQVTGLTDPSSFSADPSGETVAFTSRVVSRTAAGSAVYSDLFLLDTESRETARITTGERVWHPAINPRNGAVIAVSGTGLESFLVSVNMETGELQTIFRREQATVFNPVFSADGETIYFTMNAGGIQDIWMIPYPLEAAPPGSRKADGVSLNTERADPVTGPDVSGEFFPRFCNGWLLFASDRGGKLAVYAMPEGGGTAVLAADDPIGAYAGFLEGDEVVYATYTRKGYALKRASLSAFAAAPPVGTDTARDQIPGSKEGESAQTAVPPSSETPVAAATDRPRLPETAYHDVPRFLYWAPLPFSIEPGGILNIGNAAGMVLVMGSILGDYNLSAAFTFDWRRMGPAAYIAGSSRVRKTVFDCDLHYRYGNSGPGYNTHTTDLTLLTSYPLIYEGRFPYSRNLQIQGGLGFYLEKRVESTDPASPNPDDTGARTNTAGSAHTGVSYTFARRGAQKDFFNPKQFSGWAAINAALPFEIPEGALVGIDAGSYLQLPSLINHHVVGIGIGAGYDLLSDAGWPPFLISEEGFSRPAYPLRMTAALEYRFHIALLDLPLPYGYSLNHIAGGFFVETRAFASSDDLSFDAYLYPGFELFANIGTVSHRPVGIGVRFRIAPSSLSAFSLFRDTSVYLTRGTGGFPSRGATTTTFLDAGRDGGYATSRW